MIFYCMFFFLAKAAAQNLKAHEIYFGISNETTLPFIEIENQLTRPSIKSGILKEFAGALFKELNMTPVLVLIPKKRIAPELISGDLDLVCYAHESWFPQNQNQLLWSREITTNNNVIIGLRNNKSKVKKIEDLYGKRIGAVVNFVYSNLTPYFEKNLILRENGPNNESNLQKLIFGRVEYMILSDLEYNYHKKRYPQLVAYDLNLDMVKVKCAVSKKSSINMNRLNQAIEKLQSNGTITKIFRP